MVQSDHTAVKPTVDKCHHVLKLTKVLSISFLMFNRHLGKARKKKIHRPKQIESEGLRGSFLRKWYGALVKRISK